MSRIARLETFANRYVAFVRLTTDAGGTTTLTFERYFAVKRG